MTIGPWQLIPRTEYTVSSRLAVLGLGVAGGAVLSTLLLLLFGLSPVEVFSTIIHSAFLGGFYAISDTLTQAIPLILCGLGCAVAFRSGLWNVGAEGQLFLGAWAATGVATFVVPPGSSPVWTLTLMALAGFAAGALWGAIPGILKARYQTNEILVSLMLVYVASEWINYFIYVRWSQGGFQMTPLFPKNAWLPRLSDWAAEVPSLAGLTLHLGFVLALLAAVLMWFLMWRSARGFEWKVTGISPRVARYAGMSVKRNIVLVMSLSGGLAGLAGMAEVAGTVHRLQDNFSPGYGFTAILVAWLARLHPLGVIVAAILLSGLLVGAKEIQPGGVAVLLQGVILSTVIACDLLTHYRLKRSVAKGPEPIPGGAR